MRPPSRLLSKRSLLLPTIREGTEETVRDLNEANTLHNAVSSEDYLLSICHLAHPTFPARNVSPGHIHVRQLDAVRHGLRLSGTTPFEFNPTEEARATDVQRGEQGKTANGELMFGNSDPLEYLYGHQNDPSGGVARPFVEGRFIRRRGSPWGGQARSRAHSIPRASSPDPARQRKSSCPELHAGSSASVPNVSPKYSSTRRGSPAETEKRPPAVKQSLISQWISECRSAWREARVRACMLPAIAEI